MSAFKDISATLVILMAIILSAAGLLHIFEAMNTWMKTVITLGVFLAIGFTIFEKIKGDK